MRKINRIFVFGCKVAYFLWLLTASCARRLRCLAGRHDLWDCDYEERHLIEQPGHPGWFYVCGVGRTRRICHYCSKVGDWECEGA